MLNFNFHISTSRLFLSYLDPSKDSHCDFLVALHQSSEYIAANGGVITVLADRDAARKNIENGMEQLETLGYGRYVITLKSSIENSNDDRPFSQRIDDLPKVGFVHISKRKYEGAPTVPDIGFALMKEFWGKGYATEAANGLLQYFQDEVGQIEFLGYCHPENEDSKKMFRRLGFDDRGVRGVKGVVPDGVALQALVWSKGLKKELENYGL